MSEHLIYTSKGMMPMEDLTRTPLWNFAHSEAGIQVSLTEQYHEKATGELVKSGVDIYIIPREKIATEQGAING